MIGNQCVNCGYVEVIDFALHTCLKCGSVELHSWVILDTRGSEVLPCEQEEDA